MGTRFLTIREESYRDGKDKDYNESSGTGEERNHGFWQTDRKKGRKEGLCVQEYGCVYMCTHTFDNDSNT